LNAKSIIKLITMAVGLAACGLVVGFLAALIIGQAMEGDIGGWGGLVGVLLGLTVGYPFGVVLGMLVVRLIIKYPGSLLLGIPGSLIAPVLSFSLADAIGDPNLTFGLMFVVTPLVGTIAYHLRR
jgi:hypothetical protein